MASLNREKKRILLVEDEEDARELMSVTLEDYTLVCACDMDEGLRLAYLRYFDLYILDNWLPDGDGVELCRLIHEFDPHTPVLFCSAAAYMRDIREATLAGAQEYLVKPIIPDEIRQSVAQLIAATRATIFEARQAEFAVVREELANRQTENARRLGKAKMKRLRAEEKALRLKAQIAFLAAGGARGDFAREWPSVFLEEVLSARPRVLSGN